jgi:enoyl-CoA hydratase
MSGREPSAVGESDTVHYRVVDGVGVVTLNRPERHNAVNDEMSAAIHGTLLEALDDVAVRCVLIRGEGRSFCSGRDTSQLGQRPAGVTDYVFVHRSQRVRLAVMDSPKPVVAELRGAAIGGGCELALSADIRVSDTTLQLAMPEVRYGLVVDTGGSVLATALAGPSKAKYLMMTGDRIDAATALAWNLVDFVVEPSELAERAMSLCRRIADGAPLAVQMGKQLVDNVWANEVRATLRTELMAQTALFTSADRAEVRAALGEGRAPRFHGR